MKNNTNIPRMVNAVGHIDDDLIMSSENSRKKNTAWIKRVCIAAAMVVVAITGVILVPRMFREGTPAQNDRYKDFDIALGELAFVWSWDDMTIYEKYSSINVDGVDFGNRGSEISMEYIGELIGSYKACGYDMISDVIHNEIFEVYEIQKISSDRLIAVKMEDKYYVFISENYEAPETFGEVLKEYDLAQSVDLNRFSLEGKSDENYYILEDDTYIWDVLNECADVHKADAMGWHEIERDYISFTVTSEKIGVYKRVMYVTEDGYIWTNIFDTEYLYYIGDDNAKKILQYATDNSTQTEMEPYRNKVLGEVTEITDEYIIINDSVLCKNPSEGITYKISINDIRISRYVKNNVVKTNDIIQVTYEGEISDDIINNAVSIDNAIISGKDVLIPE